ncbi:DUF4276 family protein [candidate division KSB1 bacterium]|nr:DUF4276 family protein [candidate division KSB1 bacterium]
MVNEIRLYVEGAGNDIHTKKLLRDGFRSFLNALIQIARMNRIKFQIIACGRRNQAFSDFSTALQKHPNAFNILLVDSEASVSKSPWQHLQGRDGWNAGQVSDEHCHLMVQIMEAWLIADLSALNRFYGRGFNENAVPKNPNVEQIEKKTLLSALKDATRNTSKGEYHKTRHGFRILEQLEVAKVRHAAPHCDRLFKTLAEKMNS